MKAFNSLQLGFDGFAIFYDGRGIVEGKLFLLFSIFANAGVVFGGSQEFQGVLPEKGIARSQLFVELAQGKRVGLVLPPLFFLGFQKELAVFGEKLIFLQVNTNVFFDGCTQLLFVLL